MTISADAVEMQIDNANLVEGLVKPCAYPGKVEDVVLIETHISWVFLAGSYAYKVKKAVNFGFIDYTSLEQRRFGCYEEIRLNKRLTQSLYLEVVAITGDVLQPKLGGNGPILEYAVKMFRFPDDQLALELLPAGGLQPYHIDQLATVIARFHQQADRADSNLPFGEPNTIKQWFEENFSQINPLIDDLQQMEQLTRLQNWGREEWVRLNTLMQYRQEQGFIKECHGDLHLGNLVLIDDQLVAFDCIEFNAQLRFIDVISDISFLMMDLKHRGYEHLGFRFINYYLYSSGDYQGLRLLLYYMVYRALVKAKIALLENHSKDKNQNFQAYLMTALSLIQPLKPVLLISHGYSGSGKSTVAEALADQFCLIRIRSDLERKRMAGLTSEADSGSALNSGIYKPEISEQLYRKMLDDTGYLISAGYSVIVDAAFLKRKQRDIFRELANSKNIPFVIIACRADKPVLQTRIQSRSQQGNDPSEATLEVLQQQFEQSEQLGNDEIEVIEVNTQSTNSIELLIQQIRLQKLHK